jgi:hypothetical protein
MAQREAQSLIIFDETGNNTHPCDKLPRQGIAPLLAAQAVSGRDQDRPKFSVTRAASTACLKKPSR